MQNAKCKNASRQASFCILHFAFCIALLNRRDHVIDGRRSGFSAHAMRSEMQNAKTLRVRPRFAFCILHFALLHLTAAITSSTAGAADFRARNEE
jgi:hypothetical protein